MMYLHMVANGYDDGFGSATLEDPTFEASKSV